MGKKYAIIKRCKKYKDSGCYGTTIYEFIDEVDTYFSRKEALKSLDQIYEGFEKENSRKKEGYNGYNYERLKKNTWKRVDEYDKWHNGTYSILEFSIGVTYV